MKYKFKIGDIIKFNIKYCRIAYPNSAFLTMAEECKNINFKIIEVHDILMLLKALNSYSTEYINCFEGFFRTYDFKRIKPYKRIIKNIIKGDNHATTKKI